MNPIALRSFLLLALIPAACTQDGSEDALATCGADSTEILADLSAAPEGFSVTPQEALELTTGNFTGTLAKTDGATGDLTLTLARTGDIRLERRSWQDEAGDDVIEPAIYGDDCRDAYVFDGTLEVTSLPDLGESLEVLVVVDDLGTATLFASADFDALGGSAVPATFDPAEMESTTFNVTATADANGWAGEFSFQGVTKPSGSGSDSTVSATNEGWAEFSAAPAIRAPAAVRVDDFFCDGQSPAGGQLSFQQRSRRPPCASS